MNKYNNNSYEQIVIIENNIYHYNLLKNDYLLKYSNIADFNERIIELINNLYLNPKNEDNIPIIMESKKELITYFEQRKNCVCFIVDYQINETGDDRINADKIIEIFESQNITNFVILSGKLSKTKEAIFINKHIKFFPKIDDWDNDELPLAQNEFKTEFLKFLHENFETNIDSKKNALGKGINNLDKNHNDDEHILQAFICYSKLDAQKASENNSKDTINYLEKFKTSISAFTEHNHLFNVWDDTDLVPSNEYNNIIRERINKSDIHFILVSSNLLSTKYINEIELPLIIKKFRSKSSIILPIFIKTSGWNQIEIYKEIQGFPSNGSTLDEYGSSKIDDDMRSKIKEAIYEFKTNIT